MDGEGGGGIVGRMNGRGFEGSTWGYQESEDKVVGNAMNMGRTTAIVMTRKRSILSSSRMVDMYTFQW